MSIDFSQVFNLDFDSGSISETVRSAAGDSTKVLSEEDQTELKEIKDEYESAEKRASKYQDILEGLEDDNDRDAVLYLIKDKDKEGAEALVNSKDFSKGITDNKEAWKDVSTIASLVVLEEEGSDIAKDIKAGVKNEDGVVENDTLYKIKEEIKKDSDFADSKSDEKATEKAKELLKEAKISGLSDADIDAIEEIKGSSSSKETSESKESDEASGSLKEVKAKYTEKLNDPDSELNKQVKAAIKGEGKSARSDEIEEMIQDVASKVKRKPNELDSEFVRRRLTEVNNAVQDIVIDSTEFPDDTVVRVMSHFEKDPETSRILAYKDDGDGDGTNNTRIEGLYIGTKGDEEGKFINESGKVLEVKDGKVEHNGKKYDADEIVGKEKFQLHAGDEDDKKEVEANAKKGWTIFQHDAADIAEAQGKKSEAQKVRDRADHQDKVGVKEILMLLAGAATIIGGIIASSSGKTHRTVGTPVAHQQYPQQYHQPIGYNPGIGGGIDRAHSVSSPVNAYANKFRQDAMRKVEWELYGGPKTTA